MMATKQFKAYNPHVKAYSSRRSDDEWDQHRQMLTRMHNKCRPRREMIAQLKQKGFDVTLSQLTSQLNKWGLTIESRNVAPGSYDGRETSSTTSDPQRDDSVVEADHQFFNSLPTPRGNSPNPSRSRSRTDEVDSSRSIENEVINTQGPSPPPMSTKTIPVMNISEISVPRPPRSNVTENRSTTTLKAPQSSFANRLQRKKAVDNLMYKDLAEALLDDIEIDWHATFAEDSSGNDQQVIDMLYPDYFNADNDFLEKLPAQYPPIHDQLNKQSDTNSIPDTLVNGDSSTATQTPYNNNDQLSPIGSDEALDLYTDYDSVFGNKFSNLNPNPKPKPKPIIPEEEQKPSPKSFSLKLRDRISKNSPGWESTFPGMASAGSIIRHLPTIVEPWCSSFPKSCCCKSLFFGRDGFADSPELYRIFLEQSQSEIESLQYIMALLNLAEIKTIGSHKEVLKGKFREALEFYLKLCTRVDFKNSMASTILHRLLKVSEKLLEGEYSATKRLSTRSLSSTSLKTSALLEKIFETPLNDEQSTETTNKNSSWFKECAENAIALDYDGLDPSTFTSLNKQGRNFGMRPWAFKFEADSTDDSEEAESSTEYPRPVFDGLFLTTTAAHVATMLEHQHKSTPVRGVSELDPFNSSKVFSTLGLMIALEFSTNVSFLYEDPGPISDPAHWTSQMTRFVYTFIEGLGQNADCADKFRKAYWLARTSKIGREGKGVHTGPCKAVREWTILERSIYDFDEDRPWIERKFLANRLSLPHDNDIVLGDQMSIHSESSATSFDRFHQTAVRLQVGRVPSHRSAMSWKTTSSKRMSVESHLSWQLERVLAINDGDAMSLTETVDEE